MKRRSFLAVGLATATSATLGMKVAMAATAKVHEVQIKRFKFDPKELVVGVGDTIKWTNEDLAAHTASADDGSWDTGKVSKGESREIVVTAEMETTYFCAFHPNMKASFTIT